MEKINKLTKAQLVEKYQQTVEEKELQYNSIKKELLLTKEQLAACSIALKDLKSDKNRLISKVNELNEKKEELTTKLSVKDTEMEEYYNTCASSKKTLILLKFWILVLSISLICSTLFIYYLLHK